MTESFDLTITRFIPLPPDRVFRLWIDPKELIQWWGPPGVECTSVEIDLRIGGEYRIANQFQDGTTLWIYGVYELIEPPYTLRFTWQVGGQPEVVETVTVCLTGIVGGTEVEITHEKVPNRATSESHQRGWIGCLDGLEIYAREAR